MQNSSTIQSAQVPEHRPLEIHALRHGDSTKQHIHSALFLLLLMIFCSTKHSKVIGDDDILSSIASTYSDGELEGVWSKTDVKVSDELFLRTT
jgi:hypothetical protein